MQFMLISKHQEVAKYVALTHQSVSLLGIVISQIAWNKLSDANRAAIQQAVKENAALHDADAAAFNSGPV
ncbi:MAG: hypothetical protein IT307_02245 [Chloroflexi bacterium]|nr:hypothetical protein [Chloroflexota bacterium]